MDYETVSAAEFGASLRGLEIDLLVGDIAADAGFLTACFGMSAHRMSRDFAF